MDNRKDEILHCPCCGKAFPVRIKTLDGQLLISVRCPNCKRISEISLKDINASAAERT
jgi:phage FluMu protein Com